MAYPASKIRVPDHQPRLASDGRGPGRWQNSVLGHFGPLSTGASWHSVDGFECCQQQEVQPRWENPRDLRNPKDGLQTSGVAVGLLESDRPEAARSTVDRPDRYG